MHNDLITSEQNERGNHFVQKWIRRLRCNVIKQPKASIMKKIITSDKNS